MPSWLGYGCEAPRVLGRIAKAAVRRGWCGNSSGKGAGHEIWRCGETPMSLPRHKEIGNRLAEAVFAGLEIELGKDWWRR